MLVDILLVFSIHLTVCVLLRACVHVCVRAYICVCVCACVLVYVVWMGTCMIARMHVCVSGNLLIVGRLSASTHTNVQYVYSSGMIMYPSESSIRS